MDWKKDKTAKGNFVQIPRAGAERKSPAPQEADKARRGPAVEAPDETRFETMPIRSIGDINLSKTAKGAESRLTGDNYQKAYMEKRAKEIAEAEALAKVQKKRDQDNMELAIVQAELERVRAELAAKG